MRKKTSTQATLWSCLCIILLSTSCFEKQSFFKETTVDEEGVVISKLPIWEKDISESKYVRASVTPIFHNNTVIVPGSLTNERGMLIALDTASGKEVWRWNDYVEGYDFKEVIVSREKLNSKGNLVIYNDNNRFCAINLDNGTTLWKDLRNGSAHSNEIQIVGDYYYYPYELEENGVLQQVLMRGDLFSSKFELVVKVPMDSIQLFGGFYGLFKRPLVYADEKNDKYAFLAFSENVDLFKAQSVSSYILYSISDQDFITEKVRLPDTVAIGAVNKPVKLQGVYVITSGFFIYGIDQLTSKIIWSRKIFSGIKSSEGFIVAEYKNRLFAVNEVGFRNLVMELDPKSGDTKWIDEGNGGSTHRALYFLNDVLYFISRPDERLYAYDINSGKMLWKLTSPDYEGFTVMRVKKGKTPETDLLVACTWKNAYRFKPAR